MPTIVISYRREDSKWIAGRIFDRLQDHYGKGDVFMDIDTIPFGLDFREHIHATLKHCDILVAILGPRWLAEDNLGQRRITDETDWVRIEIEAALNNGIPVIPVLIDDTRMPKPSELPDTLRNFVFRQAAELDTGRDFHPHMERLIRSMDQLLAERLLHSSPPALVPAVPTLPPEPPQVLSPHRQGTLAQTVEQKKPPNNIPLPIVNDTELLTEDLPLRQLLKARAIQIICDVAGVSLMMFSIYASNGGRDFRGIPGLLFWIGMGLLIFGIYLFFVEKPLSSKEDK